VDPYVRIALPVVVRERSMPSGRAKAVTAACMNAARIASSGAPHCIFACPNT
jgi:hypothetical protein